MSLNFTDFTQILISACINVHAGLGQQHVSSFLAAMEIPFLYHKTLKARERKIAAKTTSVTQESCLRL